MKKIIFFLFMIMIMLLSNFAFSESKIFETTVNMTTDVIKNGNCIKQVNWTMKTEDATFYRNLSVSQSNQYKIRMIRNIEAIADPKIKQLTIDIANLSRGIINVCKESLNLTNKYAICLEDISTLDYLNKSYLELNSTVGNYGDFLTKEKEKNDTIENLRKSLIEKNGLIKTLNEDKEQLGSDKKVWGLIGIAIGAAGYYFYKEKQKGQPEESLY